MQVEVVGRDVAVGGAGGEEAAGGDEEVHEGLLVEVVPAAVVAAVDERVGPVVLGDEVAVFGQVVRSAVAPGVEELVAQAEAVAPGAELVGGIEVVAVGKAKQICPLWPKRIDPFGHNMIAPSDPNNIDHLARILPEIFLCRFEPPSPGVTGY